MKTFPYLNPSPIFDSVKDLVGGTGRHTSKNEQAEGDWNLDSLKYRHLRAHPGLLNTIFLETKPGLMEQATQLIAH